MIKAPYRNLLFLAGILVAVLAVLLFFSPQASSQSPNPQLRLHRGTFDAQEPGSLVASQASSQPAPGPYTIIQFGGPVTPADRAALENTGVTIVEYLPDFAYLVRATDSQLKATKNLNNLYAQAPFTLADKLAPSLLQTLQSAETNMGRLQIVAWPGQEELMARELSSLPFDTSGEISKDQLTQIANLISVRWIEPLGQPRILNDVARTIMGVNSVWQDTPIFGSGQIVGIADSGLDTGVQNTLSPDFAGRIAATYALGDGGDWTDQHGHGTHVAGSLAGAGVQSGANPAQDDYANSFAGIAPEASLVIQGFEVAADGAIDGIPADYYQLFNQVYTDGVRIHSNSWGDATGTVGTASEFGGYVYGTQRTDEFVWDHPDTSIFTAAGNSGRDGVPGVFGFCTGGDGVVDPDSLLSPGTAKNVITVGASESTRDSGPYEGAIWLLMSFCFSTDPILTDLIANNADGMAAFSSRGPTDDGRVKPDIIAPGTNIISNRSHDLAAGVLWGEHNANYVYSGGSSMATPLVAGMGTLVREWLTLQGSANPSAALVKATLLNTTHDMAPGQYGTGATQEIPYDRPNSVSGWGRADLGFMDPPPYYALWFDDHVTGLSTGTTVTYTHTTTQPLQVLTDTLPLRVMLTWTDPPASLSSSTNLVNDLDLVVSGPGGPYYGNDVSTGDRTNNVEGIVIDSPSPGQYQIEISAYNVPTATQPYALVVGGPLITPTIPIVPPIITHTATTTTGAGVSLPISATVTSESPPLTTTLYYSSTGDSSYTSLSMVNTSGDDYSATIPAGAVLTPTLRYYIEATDTASTVVDGPHAVTVTPPPNPPAISHSPVPSAEANTSLPITATVTSESPPLTTTLYYSSTGDSSYTSLSMVNTSGDDFAATIPAGAVLTPTLSYYIEASDQVSTTIDGPHAVTVTALPNPPDPPVISHNPVTSAEANTSLPITATVTSEGPPLTVTLYYSSTGDSSYTNLSMSNTSGDDFSASIPAGAVLTPTLGYYIEATDTVSTVVDGPHSVTVTALPNLPDPPVISHNPVTSAEANTSLPITATVTSEEPLLTVTLYYSSMGDSSYTSLSMGNTSGDDFSAAIPAGAVIAPALSYYIDASNNAGLVSEGPHQVSVVGSVLGNSYKQVQPWSFESGDTLSYTIAVHNTSTRSRIVNLVDPIPDKTTYIPGSGVASDGSLLVLVGNMLTWQGEVAPGSPVYLEFAVTTDAGLPIDAVINNAATLAEDGGEVIVLQAEAIHNPGYLLTINEGGLFTTSSAVDLRYAWRTSDGVSLVQFSNDGAFPPGADTSAWLPVDGLDPTYTSWQLTTYGNYVLPRTVYARFKDDGGLIYGPIQDDIIYDPFPPEVVEVAVYTPNQAGLSGVIGIQTNLDLSATVVVTATDEHSGVGSVQLSHSAGFESYESYPVTGARTEIPWNLDPSGQVFVRAVDRAGNVSTIEVGQGLPGYSVFLPLAIARP